MSQNKFSILIFVLVFTLCGIWWLGQWPGFYVFDTFHTQKHILDGRYFGWQSLLYGLYTTFFMSIDLTLSAMGLFQIALASIFMAYIAKKFFAPLTVRKVFFVSFMLFMVSPLNAIMPIYYNRDTLFSWLLFFLVAYNAFTLIEHRKDRSVPTPKILALGLLTLLVSSIRVEALMYTVLIPAGFLLFIKPALKNSLIYIGIYVGILLIALFPLMQFVFLKYDLSYKMTAVLNPISYIIVNRPEALSEKQKSIIEEVVSIDDIIKYQNDYEIDVFHKGKLRQLTQKSFADFNKVHREIVLDNFDLFLENRLKMAHVLFGKRNVTPHYNDDLKHNGYDLAQEMIPRLGAQKRPFSQTLSMKLNDMVRSTQHNQIFFYFAWSAWWILILAVLGIASFRWLPVTAFSCFLILARIGVVALATPAPHFKYIYSLYLFGFLIVPLAVYEWYSSRSQVES